MNQNQKLLIILAFTESGETEEPTRDDVSGTSMYARNKFTIAVKKQESDFVR